MTPLVSVVMPVLDTAAYLPAAIESILGQTFEDLELIIADDGSRDSSRDIATDYARCDRRVRTLSLPRNPAGLSGSRAANAAIGVARGDYIARMDSDDIALPNRLSVQLAHMRAHGLDICGGQCRTMDEADRLSPHPTSRDGIRNELVFRSASVNSALTVRAALMRAARYSEADAFEQYEFQTRAVFLGAWENVDEVVHVFRKHAASATHVHHAKKADSNWQLRFRYFFRMFPEAALADFQVIHRVARGICIEDTDQLEIAGRWLVRLSRVEEHLVRARMRERWEAACAGATVDPARAAALRQDFAPRIEASPT